MKKIKEIKEELGKAIINTKNGEKMIVATKTVYTYYEDGTNDCRVEMQQPINLFGKPQEVK